MNHSSRITTTHSFCHSVQLSHPSASCRVGTFATPSITPLLSGSLSQLHRHPTIPLPCLQSALWPFPHHSFRITTTHSSQLCTSATPPNSLWPKIQTFRRIRGHSHGVRPSEKAPHHGDDTQNLFSGITGEKTVRHCAVSGQHAQSKILVGLGVEQKTYVFMAMTMCL